MDDIVVAREDAATSTGRAAFLQALENQDRELTALHNQHSQELLKIQYAISALRKQYNAVAPNISRLPGELLSLIFQAFVDDYWVTHSQSSYGTNGVEARICTTSMCKWLVILHICHHWRSIALGTPSLWNRIELGCEPYVQLALRHSGDLPLDVFAARTSPNRFSNPYDSTTIVQALHLMFPRLRMATFRPTNPSLLYAFESMHDPDFVHQAPMLETLIIIMDVNENTPVNSIPILCDMDLPNLTSLAIANGSFALVKALVRPTLTALEVAFAPACSPNALVPVLEQLPLLRRLALSGFHEGSILTTAEERPSWYHTVSLPNLKDIRLKVGARPHDLVHLFCCLEFPADTQITLSLYISSIHAEQVLPLVMSKALVADTPTSVETAQLATPCVIEVLPRLRSTLEVVLWSTLRHFDLESSVTPTTEVKRLDLTVSTNGDTGMVHFFKLLDLREVVVLDIGDDIEVEIWMRIFRRRTLPKLRDLILSNITSVQEVLSLISTPVKTSSRASSSASTNDNGEEDHLYLFPTLKTLTLVSCVFRHKPQKTLRTDLLLFILRALRVRAKHGLKLEKLIIRWPINLTREQDRAALRDPRIADYVEIEQGEEEEWSSSDDDEEEDEHALEHVLEA